MTTTSRTLSRFAQVVLWHNWPVRSNLLQRFRKGDPTAIAELYDEFGGPVFTVAMSILRDRELAADATQQTFVKAWKSAHRFDPERDFAPWIYAIARRASIDLWRTERRRQNVPVGDEADIAQLPAGMERAWETFQVRSALEQLSIDERQVVKLTHYEGLTHAEAAEHLGVPIGTVKSRSHRAYRKLADSLSHLFDE